jgi:transposase
MRIIEEENNLEVLKAYSKFLINDNQALRAEIEKINNLFALKQQLSLNLEDKLLSLRRLIFGKSSERRKNPEDRSRDSEEEKLLLEAQSLVPPLKESQDRELESEVVCHSFKELELLDIAREYGFKDSSISDWREIKGFYDESKEVTVIERKYVKKIHRRKKYLFIPSKNSEKQIIVTAPGPEKFIKGSNYSIEFAVQVVSDKYVYHLPLERQIKQMNALGLKYIKPKTLYNLCLVTSVHLDEIAKRIKEEILSCGRCVHADETPWPINNKKEDDGYMWVVSNQAGSFYQFEPTRSGAVIEEILKGYQGPVLSDAYGGYNRLKKIPGITLSHCWAHARRKFNDILENYPKECNQALDLIDELFRIERKAKNFEDLKKLRQIESVLLLEKIKIFLLKIKTEARKESGLLGAANYSLKNWEGLTKFLADEKIPLSNNEAERTIRHAVMGRKNFYGSRTISGADVTAILYSVIESCKKVQLDPKTFIEMVIRMNARGEKPPTPLEYARSSRLVPTSH